MRFKDKLAQKRKENNLSQEILADKLGVSRQAVSKWESGASYPDMDKILQLCKILNCTLEDLLDDGVIKEKQENKMNSNNYLKDFLNYITKSYNMICSMTFKQKIKCILEMFIIFLLLLLASSIIKTVLDDLLIDIVRSVPKVGYTLDKILNTLVLIVLISMGSITFLHLFKIRYLDYYITIEDNNVLERQIEKPLANEKIIDNKKYIVEEKHEKIIIRDPKHSAYSFFNLIAKIIKTIIKIMIIMCAIPIIVTFISLIFIMIIALCNIKYGIIFLYIILGIIGVLLLCYIIMYIMYNFLLNKKSNTKLIFIGIICSFIIIGINLGLGFNEAMKFEYKDNQEDIETETKIEYVDVTDNIRLDTYYGEIEYIIDNDIDNIKLEITSVKGIEYKITKINQRKNICYLISENDNFKLYSIMKEDIKNKIIRNYENNKIKVKAYVSELNYEKVNQDNY